MTTQEHDKRYHNGLYEGGKCVLRDHDTDDDVRQIEPVEIGKAFSDKTTIDEILKVGIESIVKEGGRIGSRGLQINVSGEDVVIGKKGLRHGLRPFTAHKYKDLKDIENADIMPFIGQVMNRAIFWKPIRNDETDEGKPIAFKKLFVSAVKIDKLVFPVLIVVNRNEDNSSGSIVHFNTLKSFNVKRSFDGSNGIETGGHTPVPFAKLINSLGKDPTNAWSA